MTGWKAVSVEVVTEPDEDPDLSWLYQTDEQMGEGFEARSAIRKTDYVNGWWSMVGISAETELVHVTDVEGEMDARFTVRTSGTWSVESDCGEENLRHIGEDQLLELRVLLRALGLTFKNDTVEWNLNA